MIPAITINHYLFLSAALFCVGLFGVLTRRNAVGVLMSLELMLNAVNLNLVAFNSTLHTDGLTAAANIASTSNSISAPFTVG